VHAAYSKFSVCSAIQQVPDPDATLPAAPSRGCCRYEEDLERARALGSNCFRLSLEWHRIEPAKGQIDEAAVQRYHDMFECMKRWAWELILGSTASA